MRQLESIQNISAPLRAANRLRAFSAVLLALSLGMGSVLSGGCVAVPAVMVTSATLTTAAVVTEGERLARAPDEESSGTVQNDTDGELACGEKC